MYVRVSKFLGDLPGSNKFVCKLLLLLILSNINSNLAMRAINSFSPCRICETPKYFLHDLNAKTVLLHKDKDKAKTFVASVDAK